VIDLLLSPLSRLVDVSHAINHIYCCDPDTALCGVDVSKHPVVDLDDADCAVCLDLEDQPCPTCGL
jgi:hypothetical protein